MESATKRETTTWDVWTYDVWGNEEDGWDVNDRACVGRDVPLTLPVTRYNVGSPHEFAGASPSDAQIRDVLGLRRIRIETDGDDTTIHVTRARDGYPLGELYCTSHASLSPVRRHV